MRRTIIILSILFFAVPAFAGDKFPVEYHCASDPGYPIEAEFCELYRAALAETGMVDFKFDERRPYIKIIVLPTARDGYTAITVASNFLYPPLAGFSLSAHLSSYLLLPVDADAMERAVNYMVHQNLTAVAQWIVYFGEYIEASPGAPGISFEASEHD